VAPRQGESSWNPLSLSLPGRTPPAVNVPGGLDLNHTGRVELSEEKAFAVEARDGRGQAGSLSEGQRWRTETLDTDVRGGWELGTPPPLVAPGIPPGPGWRWHRPRERHLMLPAVRVIESGSLPDLGPRQLRLTFTLDRQLVKTRLLAEPLVGA